MKNQYVADIGDYGKYALLRFLACRGIVIGVNWYLTEDDGSSDGEMTKYLLHDRADWMRDDHLFNELRLINSEDRTVKAIEKRSVIPSAVFFSEKLDLDGLDPAGRKAKREEWFEGSLPVLEQAELIFADPDNGITYNKTAGRKGNEKYILKEEIERYFRAGKDVVFYCHKGRRKEDAWLKVRTDLRDYLQGQGFDARTITLTYHKGTQRSYVFVVHPKRYEKYLRLVNDFLEKGWDGAFEVE